MQNENFNYILKSFSFFFYSKENHQIQQILTQANKYPIIIIDVKNSHYILCFDNNLLIVERNDLSQLSSFFIKNKNSKIYLISKQKDEFIIKLSELNDFASNIEKQTNFFNEEIQSFLSNFQLKRNRNINNEIFIFWLKIISPSISGLLIQKAHYKSNINRIYVSKNIYQKNFKGIEIKSDEYIKLLILHQGSCSIINLIYYIKTEEIFSMKKLFDPIENANLFDREYENYLKLRHPFIAHFYGTAQIRDHKGLLIEYVDGKSLKHINEMKLCNEYKLKIIFEIILIIKYVHDNGFILRDLTPDNIMIDNNNSVVLIDFDRMIRLENANDDERTKNFDSDYIAQEIIANKSFSIEADIYSLGLLIYFIFSEKSFKIEHGKKPKLNYLYFDKNFQYLKQICNQCIEINPSKRINMDEIIFLYYFEYIFTIKDIYMQDITTFIYVFSIASDLNDAIARIFLYYIYNRFKDKRSIHYLELAANQNNNSVAQMILGFLYFDGNSVPKDITKGIHYLKLSADNNLSMSQSILGNIYSNPKFNQMDAEKSFYYKNKSDNLTISQLSLGMDYLKKGNINKALFYLMKAHNQNDEHAQHLLGLIYYNGKDVPRNIKKAIYFFTVSANNGYSESQYYLGRIFYEGDEVEVDIEKSIHYFTLAAIQNHVISQIILGRIYYKTKNIKKSIYFFTAAMKQKDIESTNSLGYIYYKSGYVPVDINKAIYFFTLAAKEYNIYSLFYLSVIYLDNKYVPKDVSRAIHYLKEASSFNHSLAKNNLAMIYKKGICVDKNIHYSIELLNEGITQKNDIVCMYNLAHIYCYEPDFQDLDKAIELSVKVYKYEFDFNETLLAVLLVNKIEILSLDNIIKEIEKYEKNDYVQMAYHIYEHIKRFYIKDRSDFYFDYTMKNDLMIDSDINPVPFSEFFSHEFTNQETKITMKKNIDNSFYEGFYNQT